MRAAPAVDLGNVGSGKFARLSLIPAHHLGAGPKNNLLPFVQSRDGLIPADRFQSWPCRKQEYPWGAHGAT